MSKEHEPAQFFECPDCGRKSYNRSDILHGWCGHCKTGRIERELRRRYNEALGYPPKTKREKDK